MNFKDQYNKDYENIKLSDDFKKSLVAKMDASEKKSKITYIYGAIGTLAVAAAAVAIVFGIRNTGSSVNEENTQVVKGTEDVSEDAGIRVENNSTENSGNSIGGSIIGAWYGSAVTDEEKLEIFNELLDNEDIEKIYESKATTFTSEDILSEEDTKDIVDKLEETTLTEEEFVGEATNYMIVFDNGDIIKLKISEEGYIKLNDMNKSCKIK